MQRQFATILAALNDGSVVPYLGPGVLAGVVGTAHGQPIPADSDSLILAMNGGKPMAPKLMYEFPRAAMNVELKRGRKALTRFLDETYRDTAWSRSPLHQELAGRGLAYIIDINRDTQLQTAYAGKPHTLIVGVARISASAYRFRIYHYDGALYQAIDQEAVDTNLPILFKPLGTPLPQSEYIASDADFVDYLTELMGGFAIPGFLKRLRQGKRYLLLGLRLNRDTERMLLSDITFGADKPAGWALIPGANAKEKRFLDKLGFELVDARADQLFSHLNAETEETAAA
jgi:hypothetical protein